MSEEIDKGKIISAALVNLSEANCYEDIRISVYKESFHLLAYSVRKIIDGNIADNNWVSYEEGIYWSVIDENKMKVVMSKLKLKPYKLQIRKGISTINTIIGELDNMFKEGK